MSSSSAKLYSGNMGYNSKTSFNSANDVSLTIAKKTFSTNIFTTFLNSRLKLTKEKKIRKLLYIKLSIKRESLI